MGGGWFLTADLTSFVISGLAASSEGCVVQTIDLGRMELVRQIKVIALRVGGVIEETRSRNINGRRSKMEALYESFLRNLRTWTSGSLIPLVYAIILTMRTLRATRVGRWYA